MSIDIERRLPTTDGQQNSWSRQEPTSFRAWVACENKSYRLRKFLSTCILNSDMALFFLSLVDNLQRFFLPHSKRIRWFPFIQVEGQRTSINNISIPTCFFLNCDKGQKNMWVYFGLSWHDFIILKIRKIIAIIYTISTLIPRMYKTYHTRKIHGAKRSRSPGKWLCDRSSSFKHVKHVIFYPWKLLLIITLCYLKLKSLIIFYHLLNHQYLTCSLDTDRR